MKVQAIHNYNNIRFQYKPVQETDSAAVSDDKKKLISLVGGAAILGATIACCIYYKTQNRFINELAQDLSKELNQKITPKHLRSVMTKEQLLKELPLLKEENYVASVENIKKGIFIADLHSHTNYSDGTITVSDFLAQAVEYGDKLIKINGKKFIVALSDHDGVEGVKEALKLIVQDPDKYKNIKFVPAVELSYLQLSSKNSERFKRFGEEEGMSEMLVYGINPFSETTKKFFNELYLKRIMQVKKAIEDACFLMPEAEFSFKEYTQFFNPQHKYCFLNQHWKVWNYLHTKQRIAAVAKEQKINSEDLYRVIGRDLKCRDRLNPYFLNEFFVKRKIETSSEMYADKIVDLMQGKYFPKKGQDGKLDFVFENTFEDLVQYAQAEDAVMGIPHPGFLMQCFEMKDIFEQVNNFVKKSGGRLKLIEKYHQAYPIGRAIEQSELEQYNKIADKIDLIKMGGRDNHSTRLI